MGKDDELITDDDMTTIMMMMFMIVFMTQIVQGIVTSTALASQSTSSGITGFYEDVSSPQIKEISFSEGVGALQISNLGVVDVYVKTNTLNTEAIPIEPGKTLEIELGISTIYKLFHYTIGGSSSISVLVVG